MGLSSGNVVGDVLKSYKYMENDFLHNCHSKDEGDVTEKFERMFSWKCDTSILTE